MIPAMQTLIFDRDFDLPPEQVFEFFSEHENLGDTLGAKITRVKDGDDGTRNGVGSVRSIKVGPTPPFEETVTESIPGELIRYRITKGSPLKDHAGELVFTTTESGTHLRWTISFRTGVPGLENLIALGLKRTINKGLAEADPAG